MCECARMFGSRQCVFWPAERTWNGLSSCLGEGLVLLNQVLRAALGLQEQKFLCPLSDWMTADSG